jgi:hypothetical protein
MSVGIKVSDKNVDVRSASPSNTIFDTEDGTVMIRQVHQISVPSDPTGGYPNYTTEIEHGLGFAPAIIFFMKSVTIGVGWRRGTDELTWDSQKIYFDGYKLPTMTTFVIYVLNIELKDEYSSDMSEKFAQFESDKVDFGMECFDKVGSQSFSSKNKKLSVGKIMVQPESHSDVDDLLNEMKYYHNLGRMPLFNHFLRLNESGKYAHVPDVAGNYSFSSKNYCMHLNSSPWNAEWADRGFLILYKGSI